MKWYEKAIPKVKDVMPSVKELCKNVSSSTKVKNIYAWGQLAEKITSDEQRIKDIDILIECNFDSGDLLAIDTKKDGALKMSSSDLEDLGFNPEAVKFTKHLLQHKVASIEFWAVSIDNKLLHWGPISETVEEWKQIKKEAERKAEYITGYSKNEISILSEDEQKKWNESYESHLQEYSHGCPQGWYASQNNTDKIFEHAVKIQ